MFVILIISLLAVLAVNAYVDARFRGLLIVQADRLAESIREAKYRTERGDAKSGKVYCKGIEIKEGDKISLVSAIYEKSSGCGNFSEETVYQLAYPVQIAVEQPFRLYFEPPRGLMRIVEAEKITADYREITVQFGENGREDLKRFIGLDPITASVSVNLEKKN